MSHEAAALRLVASKIKQRGDAVLVEAGKRRLVRAPATVAVPDIGI